MGDFEKFKEELPSKESFYNLLTGKRVDDNEYQHVLKVWNKFEVKLPNVYHDFYLTLIWVGFLGVCFVVGGKLTTDPSLKLVIIMLET